MPYRSINELPVGVRGVLPEPAQRVWRQVFNATHERTDNEGRAMAAAWTAIRNGWRKTESGEWIRKRDSYTPPEDVRQAAARGLELRREFNRGGTEIGVARARDLSNGRAVSADTIRRMVSYFARHEVDRKAEDWGNNSNPSAGWVAWLLWGGNPGRRWARSIDRRLDRKEVEKADTWRQTMQIHKIDEERNFVFGWANVSVRKDGEQVIDSQEDLIDPADLEDAAYQFVLEFRETGEMHKGEAKGHLIESFMVTPEKLEKMGLEPDALPTAWWCGFYIPSDDVFAKVKDQTYKMFSIQGRAVREEVTTNAD